MKDSSHLLKWSRLEELPISGGNGDGVEINASSGAAKVIALYSEGGTACPAGTERIAWWYSTVEVQVKQGAYSASPDIGSDYAVIPALTIMPALCRDSQDFLIARSNTTGTGKIRVIYRECV